MKYTQSLSRPGALTVIAMFWLPASSKGSENNVEPGVVELVSVAGGGRRAGVCERATRAVRGVADLVERDLQRASRASAVVPRSVVVPRNLPPGLWLGHGTQRRAGVSGPRVRYRGCVVTAVNPFELHVVERSERFAFQHQSGNGDGFLHHRIIP